MEFVEVQESQSYSGISIELEDHNLLIWNAYIAGPAGTPYAGGRFHVHIQAPPDYPFKPPKFKFMIPVYHPEVNHNGQTCIVPRDNWSPAIRIISELVVLQEMLRHPNPDDPLVPEIAKL
eukprot:CAMPEP_0168542490 /NCGR_PEP_ID=MMETSP0413-20121227/1375_1 /TAXON_ID=136452 /ORGANISM="Filamoeba nolandi, Strain NC-AS-23-1" /LENGTH=119 /DNA_ID=CAMNT_0008572369 /DNA_START=341 /DNA_END=696 /DNA_ORIENTATION=-